ncbi:hypothetical protein [Phenylobacterium sp.]|uniref:hypothetical protein n=1 Tax=Phenylobacterium sp. TaxID=1871053 RepID=UPI0028121946|nr:hypothetical protein [Phenylobacterium sp.]
MYHLRVLHQGSSLPTEVLTLERPGDVLTSVPELLARHADCERVEVLAGPTFLFAVDCKGQRLER